MQLFIQISMVCKSLDMQKYMLESLGCAWVGVRFVLGTFPHQTNLNYLEYWAFPHHLLLIHLDDLSSMKLNQYGSSHFYLDSLSMFLKLYDLHISLLLLNVYILIKRHKPKYTCHIQEHCPSLLIWVIYTFLILVGWPKRPTASIKYVK